MEARILKLDTRTADQIAAGEVVERPAAVVKELVENAVDAGATEIVVAITRGGKGQIRVTDNGSGIYEGDLDLVFERHATSKIRSISDLQSTRSLGFRGEALASICAVSQVELITMRREAESGTKVQAAGGLILKKTPVGTVAGTSIVVKDLFFNTPARLKFLKSDKAESRAITELMSHLALSHPEVAFKYILDEKHIFGTPGNKKLSDAILSVYEPGLLKQLYAIDETMGDMRLHGFISKYELTRGTRSQQFVFVNGRFIKSDLIKEIVHLAYKPYLMHNRFPVFFIFLELPPETIDVNVHPAKTEIKFHDEGQIKQLIYTTLKKSFNLYDQVPNAPFTPSIPAAPARTEVSHPTINPAVDEAINEKTETVGRFEAPDIEPKGHYEDTVKAIPQRIYEKMAPKVPSYSKIEGEQINFEVLEAMGHFAAAQVEPARPMTEPSVYEGMHYIGVFDRTYLIFEKSAQLYLIDQHAAHEKILYEQFMQAFSKEEIMSQLLLVPLKVELDALGMSRVSEAVPLLQKMGFQVEAFGPRTILIREIPGLLSPSAAQEMFRAVAEGNSESIDDGKNLEIATRACKKAVKANDTLMPIETEALLDALSQLKDPYTCPHGRPIVVRFSKNEIDKKFKRIL